MKKLFFFLAALTLSFTAQAAIINAHPNGGEDGVLTWFIGQAAEGDTVLLADGEYIQTYSVDVQTPGIVIKAAEGAKPIIKAESYFKIHKTTIWEGITFDGLNQGEHALVFRGTNAKNLILKDCEIKNYPKCLVYCDAGYHVDSLIIDNCLLHDAGRVAVYVATSTLEGNVHGCDYFEMTNSTVYNINSTDYSAGAIDIRSNNNASGMQNEILMDHVTLYNCQSTGDYGIIASYKSGNVKISNSIAANPEVFGNYSFRVYEGVEVANCLYYNASPKSGASYTSMIENQDPLFLNPSAGDFNLQPGSPAIGAATDGTNLGDPRWKVAAAELAFAMAALAADVEATDLYTIKWTVLDPDGDATIKLEYKAEEGDWTTIAENIPSTQSAYDWNIRHMPAQTVAIRGTLANATKSIVSEAAGKLTIVPEAIAPRPVRELTGLVEESALTLTWINPDQPFSTTTAIETLEQAVADGTAELTFSEDKKEVTAAYTTEAAWVQAGLKLPMDLEYVNSLTCQLKRDVADGTQIMITIEQNGYDWWYLIETDITTEWTDFSFTDFEKLGWHNGSDATALDGTNVTAIYISTNDGSPRTGSVSLRNLVVTGNAPAVADYEKTIVCVSEVAYPTTIVAEEVVYEGAASTCTLNIDPTKDLYVSVFAQDDLGNTSVAAQYKYTAPAVEEPDYQVVEDNITNFTFDLETMTGTGGPSTNYQTTVSLVLTEEGTLDIEKSSVSLMGTAATLIDGTLSNIDVYAPAANAVLRVQWNGGYFELHLTMSAAAEPEEIDIVNAVATYDEGSGELFLTATWTDSDEVTYPVTITLAGYEYKEESVIYSAPDVCSVQIGGDGDDDPWYTYATAQEVVVTIENQQIVIEGEEFTSQTGDSYYITIIGTLPEGTTTGLDNINTTVAPAKAIVNGQLVILKDGVKYNAQGATLK